MPRELVNPPSLHVGPEYTHAVIARGDTIVHFSGQVGIDPSWDGVSADVPIEADDLRAQTLQAMSNVALALEAVGATWDDVVRRTIFTTRPHDWPIIMDAINEATGGSGHPAQSVVGVVGLALPELQVEIECTASIVAA